MNKTIVFVKFEMFSLSNLCLLPRSSITQCTFCVLQKKLVLQKNNITSIYHMLMK